MSWVVDLMPTPARAFTVAGPMPGTETRSLSTSEATNVVISSSFPACEEVQMEFHMDGTGRKWLRRLAPAHSGCDSGQRSANEGTRKSVRPVPLSPPLATAFGCCAVAVVLTTPLEPSEKPAAAISSSLVDSAVLGAPSLPFEWLSLALPPLTGTRQH